MNEGAGAAEGAVQEANRERAGIEGVVAAMRCWGVAADGRGSFRGDEVLRDYGELAVGCRVKHEVIT